MNNDTGIYHVGLNKDYEAVISAHFMQAINQQVNFNLYSPQEFAEKTCHINAKLIVEQLIPILLQASDKFILERVAAADIRARENFKKYGLNASQEIGLAEKITEVMFDRQFIKGSKKNVSRRIMVEKIRQLTAKHKPINMIIPALPYKSSSPLKSRGIMPDLAEVNFLLGLTEIVKTIDFIYQSEYKNENAVMASFTVICDGRRFNRFLNESDVIIDHYQTCLREWIAKLGIADYVEILDYQEAILNQLSPDIRLEKKAIKDCVCHHYTHLMTPLLNFYDLEQTVKHAIKLDPDPELSNPEGRFIPLFKSLIYIIHYRELSHYSQVHQKNYGELYIELTRHLFKPYLKISQQDMDEIQAFCTNPQSKKTPSQEKLLEYLRQSMLKEAWVATINYIAEIRSDRDLPQDPISTCFPHHIRWTIHAKPGQLAVLTTTAYGDPVQPWHGIGVFMRTKSDKIKLYTLPVLALESNHAIPVVVAPNEQWMGSQPLFYLDHEIKLANMADFLVELRQKLIRKRKH